MFGSDVRSFTICAVGDISLGDSPKMLGIGVRNIAKLKGSDYLFARALEALQGDLVFGNLEGPLSNRYLNPHNLHSAPLLGDPIMARALKKAGFTVVNVANNHTMQYGPWLFQETCELLISSGINVVGLKGSSGWHCRPLCFTLNDRRLGMLAYSDRDDHGFEPLYALNTPVMVFEDLERLRPQVDTLIVSLHWGDEFVRCPSPAQVSFAHAIIDAGVDLILGHHPHVIQRMEQYRSSWICYSLGNFVSDMVWNPRTVEGLVPLFRVSDAGTTLIDIHQAVINKEYAPKLKPITSSDILTCVAQDESVACDESTYRELVVRQRRRHRNLGHLHLIRNCRSFHLSTYTQIWAQSLRSLLGIKVARTKWSI